MIPVQRFWRGVRGYHLVIISNILHNYQNGSNPRNITYAWINAILLFRQKIYIPLQYIFSYESEWHGYLYFSFFIFWIFENNNLQIWYLLSLDLQSLCTTNAGERTQNQAGIFKMTEGVNMNSLTQIASFPRCSEVQCAFSCMTDRSCWYYTILKFNPVCGRCLLFGGTVSLLGVSGDSHANLFRLNG